MVSNSISDRTVKNSFYERCAVFSRYCYCRGHEGISRGDGSTFSERKGLLHFLFPMYLWGANLRVNVLKQRPRQLLSEGLTGTLNTRAKHNLSGLIKSTHSPCSTFSSSRLGKQSIYRSDTILLAGRRPQN